MTMTEVLAVAGISGTLATLTVSGLGSASETASAAKCVGNLRQWGAAVQAYVADSGGFLPRRGQGIQPVWVIDRPEDWFNALTPYLEMETYHTLYEAGRAPKRGDRSVFVCPAAKPATGMRHFITYGMNMYLSRWDSPERTRVVGLPSPGTLAVLADSPGGYASTVPSSQAFSVAARHRGRANVLFLDGRVQAFDGEYLGVGARDQTREDVRWRTGIDGDNWKPPS